MPMGIAGRKAPELHVTRWIDGQGQDRVPLQLSELGDSYKLLYCFQHGCPGCHAQGFPTLRRLVDDFADKGWGFAVIQTVFEEADANTFDKLRENQRRYGLEIPFGHDLPGGGERHPSVMEDYYTAGTPWFIVIDPQGQVIFNDFQLNADRFIEALQHTESVALNH